MDSELGSIEDHTYSTRDNQLIPVYLASLDKEYESPAGKALRQKNTMRCHNCGLWILRSKRYNLVDPDILHVIKQWIQPRPISSDNLICGACWDLATEQVNNPDIVLSTTVGHKQVCIVCGRSLSRAIGGQIRSLKGDTCTHICLRYLIAKVIHPRTVTGTESVCRTCYLRDFRMIQRVIELTTDTAKTPHQQPDNEAIETQLNAEEQNTLSAEQTIPSDEELKTPEEKLDAPQLIYLPHYAKAPDTQESCCFPNCDNEQKLPITEALRVRIFCDYNYYVPRNCTTCEHHKKRSSWKLLLDALENPERWFSAAEIENVATLLKS